MRQWAVAQAAKGKKAYTYFFTHVQNVNGQPSPQGATHTAELSFTCNNPKGQPNQTWTDVDTEGGRPDVVVLGQLHHEGRPERRRAAAVAGVQEPHHQQGDGVRRCAAGGDGDAGGRSSLFYSAAYQRMLRSATN